MWDFWLYVRISVLQLINYTATTSMIYCIIIRSIKMSFCGISRRLCDSTGNDCTFVCKWDFYNKLVNLHIKCLLCIIKPTVDVTELYYSPPPLWSSSISSRNCQKWKCIYHTYYFPKTIVKSGNISYSLHRKQEDIYGFLSSYKVNVISPLNRVSENFSEHLRDKLNKSFI